MTILLDFYQYEAHITGTDRLAFHLLDELQKIDSEHTYTVLCSQHEFVKSSIYAPNFRILTPPRINLKNKTAQRIINKIWKELVFIRSSIRKYDTYYSVHNMHMTKWRVARRMILNDMDLIPIMLEDYKNIGRLSFEKTKQNYIKNVTRADAVIAISEFSRQELIDTLHANPSKVFAVPLAAEARKPNANITHINSIRIPEHFLFTIGGSEKRKNVITAMKAHSLLPSHIQKKYPLLIAGGNWQGHKLPTQNNCVQLGFVSDEELTFLYSTCDLFIFPTTYEGFGLPLLEAGIQRAAVLSAKGTSLDEITNEVLPTFPATDFKKLSTLMKHYLTNQKALEELKVASHGVASQYSWRSTASKVHAVLTDRSS